MLDKAGPGDDDGLMTEMQTKDALDVLHGLAMEYAQEMSGRTSIQIEKNATAAYQTLLAALEPKPELCGAQNPDYPGEYACESPKGHGPILNEDNQPYDHAAPSKGAWWAGFSEATYFPDAPILDEPGQDEPLYDPGLPLGDVDDPKGALRRLRGAVDRAQALADGKRVDHSKHDWEGCTGGPSWKKRWARDLNKALELKDD